MPTISDLGIDVDKLFKALLPLAFVIMTAGLVGAFSGATSPADQLQVVVRFIVIVAVLSQFAWILDESQTYVDRLVREDLKARPDEVNRQYLDMVSQRGKGQEGRGFWERVFNPGVTIVEGIVTAILWLAALTSGFVVYLAYQAQKLLLLAIYALSPVFFSFLAVSAIRPIGVQYLLHAGAVLLWPLGWGFCSLVTQALLKAGADQSFFIVGATEGGLIYALRNLIFGFLVALWVHFSTIAAPIIIQKFLTTGANLGELIMKYRRPKL